MKKIKRTVNKKMVDALIGYAGMRFQDLADRMDPPVARPSISNIMLNDTANERLQNQVTEVLRPVVAELASELRQLHDADLLDALFPCVYHESVAPPRTEEHEHNLPG